MDTKQRELAQVCIDLENQIWETFSKGKRRCRINNEDWTDAHQEYLEYQWFIKELNESYIKAQKEFFAYLDSIGETSHCKVRTAEEYYKKQKDFEDTVAYYKKHHINGF
jgi:hypothetical protein